MSAPATAADGAAELERLLARERRALTGYCYRMLGSAFDADDAVQEAMLRAWRGLDGYRGRAPLRSWLYRIATNVCLDALAGRRRRALPMDLEPPSDGDRPAGPASPEVHWIQPLPDGRARPDADPADATAWRDSVRLAFVAALQHLPPRPRAVVILRDVLGWQATEVADLLDMSPTAVHSMLQRARRTLAAADPGAAGAGGAAGLPVGPGLGPTELSLLARYVDAFGRYDVPALVALLHEDAVLSMPPNPGWLRGPAAIERWWRGHGAACRGVRMVRVRANGSPALALYRRGPGGAEAFGIQVVEVVGSAIGGLHTFLDAGLFRLFDLPLRWDADALARAG